VFHAHQAGGPLLQDALLLHADGLDLHGGLQQGERGCRGPAASAQFTIT
jgi:hypothetical protein